MLSISNQKILKYLLILSVFFLSIYVGLQIKFFNNDDWVHYKTVENFLNNNFTLHPYLGSTFYTQGILAFMFAKLFGVTRLSVLTLLISVVNVFIFYKILNLIHKKNRVLKFLLVSLLILNPLYLYSSIGFMTENYVALFILIAIYFQLKYEKTNEYKNLTLSGISVVLGFFAKQYSVFLAFGSIIYLAFKGKWRPFIFYLISTFILLLFYYFIFPKNEILSGQTINIRKLFDIGDTLNFSATIFLYLTFFTLPLSLFFVFNLKSKKLPTLILFGIILIISLYFLSASTFPQLTNVFTQKGLFPDLNGNKSQWAGYFKFFTYSFYISIIISSLAISKFILNIKDIFIKNKFLLTSFAIYFGLCLVLPVFYDRYLLPLFIIYTLILYKFTSEIKISKIFIGICILWMPIYLFFNYLYIADFIVRNNVINTASDELIDRGIKPEYIYANRAWNNYYGVSPNDARYAFSFDGEKSFDLYEHPTLEKTVYVNFPLNIFTSNKIYLYRIQE